MNYVDSFLIPVPKENLDKYKEMAELCSKVWIEHGALSYNECVAEDVKPGKVTSFPQSVDLKDGETIIFAWITYKSREDRDRVNKLAMDDQRLSDMMDPKDLPFDGMRMIWGGFQQFIKA